MLYETINGRKFLYRKYMCPHCKSIGVATRPKDFFKLACNGETVYSIKCDICGKAYEVPKDEIEQAFLPYIP